MNSKKLYLYLAIAVAIGTLIGFMSKVVYDAGCQSQKVEAVTYGQMTLQEDVKEIKRDLGDVKTDVAVTKKSIENIERWIKPTKEAFNAVQK